MPADPDAPAPAVSVVIPAWNRRGTLRMSVDSVLRQTFTDFELIVVDDGSTDGTMEAIADITDPRLRRLAHEVNKGASAARNTGIKAARGTWVAFHDSDDEWLPLKLEKQMARLAGTGPEVVACYTGMVNVLRPSDPKGRTALQYIPHVHLQEVEGDLYKAQLELWFIPPPTLVARRSKLLAIGGFDESLVAHEDWDCTLRLAEQGAIVLVDEPLVLRNYSENGVMSNFERVQEGLIQFFEKHRAEIARNFPNILADHLVKRAGRERRADNLSRASVSLAAAARMQPLSLSIRLRQLRLRGLMLIRHLRPRADS